MTIKSKQYNDKSGYVQFCSNFILRRFQICLCLLHTMGLSKPIMSSYSECAISNLGKIRYVSAYHRILKVCSHETVEMLLFLSSNTVLYAAFFFNMHVVLLKGVSTLLSVQPVLVM